MSPWGSCLVLGVDGVLVALSGWLAQGGSLLGYLSAVALLTFALLHFYLIHHECVHGNVFARDRYHVLLGHLLGWALLYPFAARRRSHLQHHVWAGHLARDPTNARARSRLARLSPRALAVLQAMWRAWIPFLAFNERIGLWRTALRVRPRSCRTRLEYAATRLALFGYALGILACAFEPVVLRWIGAYLPALGLSLVCEELINLPHHIEAATTTRKLPLWEQTRVTHSCSSVPVWSSAVLLHFNLHAAHHLFPSLPWYRLPNAQRALAAHAELAVLENELRVSVRLRRAPFAQVFAAYLSARPDDSE